MADTNKKFSYEEFANDVDSRIFGTGGGREYSEKIADLQEWQNYLERLTREDVDDDQEWWQVGHAIDYCRRQIKELERPIE